MRKQIKTEILIQAKPERVWEVLTNFENYPNWNPFIKSISGEKHAGGKLEVRIQPPNRDVMTFKPRVLSFESAKELRWLGSMGIKGIFDGEHYFQVNEEKEGSSSFIHGEKFRGILVGLLANVLKDSERGFQLMNEALKKECEKQA